MTRRCGWICLFLCAISASMEAQIWDTRITEIEAIPRSETVEIRIHGEGVLEPRARWTRRSGREIYVLEFPNATLAREYDLEFGNGRADTSVEVPWDVWPLQRLSATQRLSPTADSVAVELVLEPVRSADGRSRVWPDIKIAEGVSQVTLTIARTEIGLREVPIPAEALVSGVSERAPRRFVSLRFQGAPLFDVLQTMAMQARMNLIIDPNVTGTVSIQMADATVEDALDAVLEGTAYGWVIDGKFIKIISTRFIPESRVVIPVGELDGIELANLLRIYVSNPTLLVYDPIAHAIIYVSNLPQEANMLRDIAKEVGRRAAERPFEGEGRPHFSMVPLRYADAAGIVSLLSSIVAADGVVLTAEQRSRSILVRAPNRLLLERTVQLIGSVDRPASQVLLKARIVESSVDASRILGIQWPASASFTVSGVSQISKFPLRLDEPFGNDDLPGEGITAGTLSAGSMTAVFNFLKNEGNATLLSAPEILVMDREDAEIVVGSREPVRTTTTSNGVVSENIQFIDVGILLQVTPEILADSKVLIRVHPENSSASASGIAGVPRISTSEATTRIIVEHGQTAVIGGLYSHRKTNATSRVPLLSKIPLIGELFKNRENTNTRSNLMVFITPYIVSSSGRIEPLILGDDRPEKSPMSLWVQELRERDQQWMSRIDAGAATSYKGTVGATP